MPPENEIAIEIEMPGTVVRIFEAWTNPSDLEEWLADRASVQAHTGGAYRLETDGGEDMPGLHLCSGRYLEFDAPHKLVMSWKYEGSDPAETVETTITVELVPSGEGSVLRFRESGGGLETAEDRAFSIDAWNGAFEALAALVED